jgi:AAA family ATP:ADP antiporter
MLERIKRALWGDMTVKEFKEFSLLAVAFFLIIGAYWMLALIKNATFMHLVGPQNLPYATIVSFISLLIIVLFYNKLVDWFENSSLMYLITAFYGILFLVLAYLLSQSAVGILSLWGNNFLGWAIYVTTESLGLLVVTSFWSFVANSVNTSSAKIGYPIIFLGGQFGSLLGASLLASLARVIGVPVLTCIAAGFILVVPLVIKIYTSKHTRIKLVSQGDIKNKPTGILEGLRLIFAHPYLMGILVVSTAYDIITFLFLYQMNSAAHVAFGNLEKVTSFLGIYGIALNTTSLLFALLGTSFVIRRFGLTACLVAYPLGISFFVIYTWIYPTIWSLMAAVVGFKALGYTLNNPCKEIMYIPTSKDVKFKAKSWIDVQGTQSAKTCGAVAASMFSSLSTLLVFASIISLGIIAVWIPIAFLVGKKNQELVNSGTIIQ